MPVNINNVLLFSIKATVIHSKFQICFACKVIHSWEFVGNTDFGLPVFFFSYTKTADVLQHLNKSGYFMSECCIRLLKTSHMCHKIYTVWSRFPYLVWSSCHDRDPGHICAIKTRLVCIAPEEPSCKLLRGMPPAAASQREPRCKASEVTLFGPKHSVRNEEHVRGEDAAKPVALNKQVCGVDTNNKRARAQELGKSSVDSNIGK